MKILLLIFFGFILFSCGHGPTKSNGTQNKSDEFYWIDEKDFTPTDEIVYRPVNDRYNIDPEVPNALSRETLVSASPMDLKILIESNDPISKSIALCYQHNYTAAFKIFDHNFNKYRSHPSYWNQIGTCYFTKKEYKKAILYYHRARIKGKSGYAPAMNNLGVIYVHKKRYQEALEAFKRAASVNENALTPKLNIVQLYIKFGQLDKAKKLLSKMKNINVSDPSINSLLGTIAVMKKNYKQALIYYNFIPENLWWRADFSINHALALYLDGEKRDALDVFSKINSKRLGILGPYYQKVKQRITR